MIWNESIECMAVSYTHLVVLGVMLCRFHPLTDKVGVLVHKVYDALVVFGRCV